MKNNNFVSIQDFENKYGVRFTLKHTGKMNGMISLSTSCTCNKFCLARIQNKESICSHCFADTMQKRYKTLRAKLEKNTEILTSIVIPVQDWPVFNVQLFRLESFGDLNNEIQVINYFNLAAANKNVTFALWTKNPWIIENVIKSGYKKPENMIVIFSSYMINMEMEPKYNFIDKVFTVYDKKFIQENNVSINCGARNCFQCRKCYTKTDSVESIREQLK